MTVKELIEQLQALDPHGEKEIIVKGEYEHIIPTGIIITSVEYYGGEYIILYE